MMQWEAMIILGNSKDIVRFSAPNETEARKIAKFLAASYIRKVG